MNLKDATVLIVDDEVGLLRIFKKWFEREGCHVLTTENGYDALENLKRSPIDVIISDVRMPKMDGIELAGRVKQMRRCFPRIIFLSGFAGIDERECCDLGIEFKLEKPIRHQNLVSTARTCLTGRDELWREPSGAAADTIFDRVFENLRGAQAQGLIAFGYGGICVHSGLAVHAGDRIALNLQFTADRHAIAGEGVVRWTARDEQQIGIKITYIDEPNRAWLVDLAERNETVSFIPRRSDLTASAVFG